MRKNQEKNTPDKRVSAEVSKDDKKAVEQNPKSTQSESSFSLPSKGLSR